MAGTRRGKGKAVGAPPSPRTVAPEPSNVALPEAEARRVDLAWAAFVIVGLAATFLVLQLFGGVGVPVLLSVGLAYALDPVVTALERRGIGRAVGTTMVLGGLSVAIVGFVLWLIPVLVAEGARLPDLVAQASAAAIPRVESTFGVSLPDLWSERAASLGGDLSGLLEQVGPTAASALATFAGSTVGWVVTALGLTIVPVIAFYLLRDLPVLVQDGYDLLPRRYAPLLSERFGAVHHALAGFVQGQLAVGALLGICYVIGLSISGVQLAVVIGLLAGFGNLVPYLGTGIGVLLAASAALLHWSGPGPLIGVALTFTIGQLLEGFVITPRIVGEKVGLSAVVVIVAILAFGEVFGFTGVLLAVPAAAVIKVVTEVLVRRYRRTALYLGEEGT